MDAGIITEIANQLGIAATEVEAHIGQLWPMYVQASQVYGIVSSFGSLLIFIVCLILFLIVWKKADKEDYEELPSIFFMVCFAFVGILALIITLVFLPQAITCIADPDGAAMMRLIETLKG